MSCRSAASRLSPSLRSVPASRIIVLERKDVLQPWPFPILIYLDEDALDTHTATCRNLSTGGLACLRMPLPPEAFSLHAHAGGRPRSHSTRRPSRAIRVEEPGGQSAPAACRGPAACVASQAFLYLSRIPFCSVASSGFPRAGSLSVVRAMGQKSLDFEAG